MADVKELILTIVRPLVSQPEAVSLEIEESTDFLEYNLTVAKEDIGRIIGKQGRVAKAIRTIVYLLFLYITKKFSLLETGLSC